MIKAENARWNDVEHSQFVMPYAGYLVLHSVSGDAFTPQEQLASADYLTGAITTSVRMAEVDADPELDRATFLLEFEADSDIDALRQLSILGIEAWMEARKDASDLEFVAAHLAYLPELQEAAGTDNASFQAVRDMEYLADRLSLIAMGDEGDFCIREPHEIFYEAHAAYT